MYAKAEINEVEFAVYRTQHTEENPFVFDTTEDNEVVDRELYPTLAEALKRFDDVIAAEILELINSI